LKGVIIEQTLHTHHIIIIIIIIDIGNRDGGGGWLGAIDSNKS